jgi:hypothetical protein
LQAAETLYDYNKPTGESNRQIRSIPRASSPWLKSTGKPSAMLGEIAVMWRYELDAVNRAGTPIEL